MTTSSEIAKTIKMIWSSRGQEPPAEAFEAWEEGLEGLTVEQIAYGRKRWLQEHESEFKPNPAAFRKYCMTHKGIDPNVEAMLAFDQLFKNLNRCKTPVFKNTIIAECVRRLGGWESVCGWLTSEQPFRKKEFCEIYVALKKTERQFDPVVKGKFEELLFIGGFNDLEKKQMIEEIPKRKQLSEDKQTDERLKQMIYKPSQKFRELAQKVRNES